MSVRNRKAPRSAIGYRPGVSTLEERLLMAGQFLSGDVLTYHVDNSRTSVNTDPILTQAAVNSTNFGKVGFDAVDGKGDAQPLVKQGVTIPGQGVHDVLVVATEHDSVYGFDAESGATLWHVSMLEPGEVPSDPVHGTQVVPEIGITSTPVIDPTTGTIYLVAMSKSVVNGTTTYFQRIHALDIATGADKLVPKSIDGSITYPGTGPGGDGTKVIFDPMQYKERDALILVNGVVYTSWASHSDVGPYTGWVIGFRTTDLGVASVLNVDPNGAPKSSFLDDGSGSSFWNSGAGPAADFQGNLYNISGNGPFDPSLNTAGFPANGDYGDSYLKLSTNGGLFVSDYFTPSNQQQLANNDTDLGSSGVALASINNPNGTSETFVIGSGKDGNIYVLNADNLGHFHAASNAIVQEIVGQLGGAEFGSPAIGEGMVFFGAVGAPLKAFSLSSAGLSTTPVSQTATSFGYPGTTPAISEGNSPGGDILWAVENGTDHAVLHAYNPADLSKELYNSDQAANGRDQFGPGNKFITPMTFNGRVYVGTTDGVAVFGILPGGHPAPLTVTTFATPNPVTGTTTVIGGIETGSAYPAPFQGNAQGFQFNYTTISSPAGAPAPIIQANPYAMAYPEGSRQVVFAAPGTYTFGVTVVDPSGRSGRAP